MIQGRHNKKGGHSTSIPLRERLSMLLLVTFSFMMGSMITTYVLSLFFFLSFRDDEILRRFYVLFVVP